MFVVQPRMWTVVVQGNLKSVLTRSSSSVLEALMRDFVLFGGKIVIRKFDTPRDLMSLTEPVIVNCTGLGSRALLNDEELVPIKGQLTVLVPQPEVSYRASGQLANGNGQPGGMNPRTDGIVFGNLADRGNWSLQPDQDVAPTRGHRGHRILRGDAAPCRRRPVREIAAAADDPEPGEFLRIGILATLDAGDAVDLHQDGL